MPRIFPPIITFGRSALKRRKCRGAGLAGVGAGQGLAGSLGAAAAGAEPFVWQVASR